MDTDWASDVNDHKSMLGFVFMLAGGAVSWGSKKAERRRSLEHGG
jgi:hypothetical protein